MSGGVDPTGNDARGQRRDRPRHGRPRPRPGPSEPANEPTDDAADERTDELSLSELLDTAATSAPPRPLATAAPPRPFATAAPQAPTATITRRAAATATTATTATTTFGDSVSAVLPSPLRNTLIALGGMYSMAAASFWGLLDDLIHRKFQFAEFMERSWFLVSVTLLPVVLVATPLGIAIALQVGALASQIGASSFVGAADAVGVLREASPIVTALLLAGVGGSAVCAELGARTIREEIDAMVVLGLNPLRRLVAPLLVAGVVVSALLNLIVIFVSILSAYLFDIGVLHGTKGSFFASFTQFATVADFVTSELKACAFGVTAMLIAAYKGLNTKRGPTGVGEAVNQAVVITGIILFGINLVITEIFFAVVPQRTF